MFEKSDTFLGVLPVPPGYFLHSIMGGPSFKPRFRPREPVIGFVLIRSELDDGGWFVRQHPITARTNGIVTSAVDEVPRVYVIEGPDGTFRGDGYQEFASLKEAEQELVEYYLFRIGGAG